MRDLAICDLGALFLNLKPCQMSKVGEARSTAFSIASTWLIWDELAISVML
jgi:hypothetical protein